MGIITTRQSHQSAHMQIYRIRNTTPQVCRISKTIPTQARNMAFFPRLAAHELSPLFSRGDSGLFRLLDDYANVMASRAGPSFTNSMRTFQPRFDMKESKDAYELHGELPGIAQKDINIEFTDPNTLSIRGRTESVREEGRRPTSIESPPGQQKLTDTAETESVASSANYHKASVEDEATASGANPDATPAETPAASEAPAAQSQEVAQAQQDDAPNYWFSERSVGSFARSFSFPQRVDQEAVKASLKDGILSIVVPKAPAPALRKIDIE